MAEAKTFLIVLRHAHAAKAEAGQADFDRPLDERGRREAGETGRALLDIERRPARIVCSGALRTRQTVAHLGADFQTVDTVFDDGLYHDGTDAYLATVRQSDDRSPLMLVGHNPSVAEFIGALAGDGDAAALRRLAEGVPPGAFALVEFETPFRSIAKNQGFLRRFFAPTRR